MKSLHQGTKTWKRIFLGGPRRLLRGNNIEQDPKGLVGEDWDM